MPLASEHLNELVRTLATGFETLLAEVLTQKNLASDLRQRLDRISHEKSDKATTSDFDTNEPMNKPQFVALEDPIQKASHALHVLGMSQMDKVSANIHKCPVRNHASDQEDFEHDFTTQGKAGSLECPFARMAQNQLPITPDSHIDPLAAEFHHLGDSTALEENEKKATGQCPIRFLDQHSPEELAKYFENHKHEIPRSHEVCVRRYQQNEHGIRQLDAKYGNLVNMIQGLGVKHKQFLPKKGELQSQDSQSAVGVNRWAEDVDERSQPGQHTSDDEVRESHFQRPLREVRVGESPSRPWGIPVPLDQEIAQSVPQSIIARNDNHQQAAAGITPIANAASPLVTDDTSVKDPTPRETPRNEKQVPNQELSVQARPPQIVFNGPMFLGYSAEEAVKFLQNLNSANTIAENQ